MLWARTLQWDRSMHNVLQFVSKQRDLCILVSIPSLREGKQVDYATHHDRLYQVHASNEPQHHYSLRFHVLIDTVSSVKTDIS
ncbi:hypothetical protein SCA6_002966 [Theobroma cacao]